MESITPHDLRLRLQRGETITVIDIREAYEYEDGHIDGINIPIGDIGGRIEEIRALAQRGDIVVHCRTGSRSVMAYKMLTVQYKLPNVLNLEGGYEGWQNAGQD
jgi:rhodanese-related sulfurtransferase